MTVQQTEDLIRLRMAKSGKYLSEAEQHFKFEFYDTCINRTYYSCFYMVNALLLKHGHKPKTHAVPRTFLSKYFVVTGLLSQSMFNFFSDLAELRMNADYNEETDLDKEVANEKLNSAKIFIAAIEKLISETN